MKAPLIATPMIATEEQRMAALRRYEILDTPPEESFDALVRLGASICKTPIALVTLVDEARQWFKARVGLDALETSREIAFCAHAIDGNELFIVPDATRDERFRDNPLVTEDPSIRFYAGMPLITSEGDAIGTFCVIDRKPRADLTPHERECVQLLARETMTQIELRRALMELDRAKHELQDLNMDLEAFGAAVAHDLRAPLRSIDGLVELLAETATTADGPRHIAAVRHACARMQAIIDALLRLSRLSTSKLIKQPINLSALVRELLEEIKNNEPTRRFTFVIASDITTVADAGLLRIALTNLLSNAAKFTRRCSETRIEFGKHGDEFFVRDNGVGYDPAVPIVPPMPFARRHPSNEFEGVGLGLTIVQRIFARHQGSWRAEGELGKGTTFFFTLGPKK